MANPFEGSKKLQRSPVRQANTQQNTTAEESQQQQRDSGTPLNHNKISNDEQQQQNGAPSVPECNAQKKEPLQKSRILIEKLGEQINELLKYVKGHRNVHADIKTISRNLKSAHTRVITQLDNEERKRPQTSPNQDQASSSQGCALPPQHRREGLLALTEMGTPATPVARPINQKASTTGAVKKSVTAKRKADSSPETNLQEAQKSHRSLKSKKR